MLLRVQVGSCNSRGPPTFAIPPPSVLERSLYLLGFPAAGMAAVAGFYYATKAQSRLQYVPRVHKSRLLPVLSHLDTHAKFVCVWFACLLYFPHMPVDQLSFAVSGAWARITGLFPTVILLSDSPSPHTLVLQLECFSFPPFHCLYSVMTGL